jgi:hypothetical protein
MEIKTVENVHGHDRLLLSYQDKDRPNTLTLQDNAALSQAKMNNLFVCSLFSSSS